MVMIRNMKTWILVGGALGVASIVVAQTLAQEIDGEKQANVETAAATKGLVAFWDFSYKEDENWASRFDSKVVDRSFPVKLKRIGDPKSYSAEDWSYQDDDSKLVIDKSGPFGKGIRFNQGHIYAAVDRKHFDGTPLDLRGKNSFTLISWCKFIPKGKRHMVAGIWDEGGWSKYAGRRQAALFGGLFKQKGVIAHISATGAASYPQSELRGAVFARIRAIDGQAFKDDQWIAMAMSYDSIKGEISAYLNGKRTPINYTDEVMQDVFRYSNEQAANPSPFDFPVYSPRSFVLKYNGYNLQRDGISEHRLTVDLNAMTLLYEQEPALSDKESLRLFFDIKREGNSLLDSELQMKAVHFLRVGIPMTEKIRLGDVVWTRLERKEADGWKSIGSVLKRVVQQGAPFTFGRALGLGSESLKHGSQVYIDGVAVFNRVLSEDELKRLSFGLEAE